MSLFLDSQNKICSNYIIWAQMSNSQIDYLTQVQRAVFQVNDAIFLALKHLRVLQLMTAKPNYSTLVLVIKSVSSLASLSFLQLAVLVTASDYKLMIRLVTRVRLQLQFVNVALEYFQKLRSDALSVLDPARPQLLVKLLSGLLLVCFRMIQQTVTIIIEDKNILLTLYQQKEVNELVRTCRVVFQANKQNFCDYRQFTNFDKLKLINMEQTRQPAAFKRKPRLAKRTVNMLKLSSQEKPERSSPVNLSQRQSLQFSPVQTITVQIKGGQLVQNKSPVRSVSENKLKQSATVSGHQRIRNQRHKYHTTKVQAKSKSVEKAGLRKKIASLFYLHQFSRAKKSVGKICVPIRQVKFQNLCGAAANVVQLQRRQMIKRSSVLAKYCKKGKDQFLIV